MTVRFRELALCSAMLIAPVLVLSQTDEAQAVFDGKSASRLRGGTWKVVYGSARGPEGKSLEVLTAALGPALLRDAYTSTSLVLPLERAGDAPLRNKRDSIVVGTLGNNAVLRRYFTDLPAGGYGIRTVSTNGHNLVLLAGAGPREVLWATFDFLDTVVLELEERMSNPHRRYAGTFFREGNVPSSARMTAPETPVRSVFSWGHVIDDYEETFRELARLRFNRIILWNDQAVVNAEDVVRAAHAWGLEVLWGFSWGWTMSGRDGPVDFDALADGIVSDWRKRWRPMGGDGIYFQSFTETEKRTIGGKSIPEAVVALVNGVSARIRSEMPAAKIVFGLHANSMRTPEAESALAKTDPALEILWENCGGFPFWEERRAANNPDEPFVNRILALNGQVGLVWKAQPRIDWKHFVNPAGPFLLGRAGAAVAARDRSILARKHASFDESWLRLGEGAYRFLKRIRAGAHPPLELNAVAEYVPPFCFATTVQAELFWSTADEWTVVSERARRRVRAGMSSGLR